MDTTLYGVLGVAQSAGADEIRRAYRKKVKDHHPDVSDAADARAQFKRVRTAKAVLIDGDERARYDRLGHETYVRRYLDADTWGVSESPSASSTPSAGAPSAATVDTAQSTAEGADRRQHRAEAGTAAAYYRPGERIGVEPTGTIDRVSGVLGEVGVALAGHLLLLLGTGVLAAWLIAGSGGTPTLTSLVVAAAMVGITGCLSVLHVTSTLFQ